MLAPSCLGLNLTSSLHCVRQPYIVIIRQAVASFDFPSLVPHLVAANHSLSHSSCSPPG